MDRKLAMNYGLLVTALACSVLARTMQQPWVPASLAALGSLFEWMGFAAFALGALVAIRLWLMPDGQKSSWSQPDHFHYRQQMWCIGLCLLSSALSTLGWFVLFRWNGALWQMVHVRVLNVVLLLVLLVVVGVLGRGLYRAYFGTPTR